jgi:hypothetical protein
MPIAVAVVGMTEADASEETGLFRVVAIQLGTSRPGFVRPRCRPGRHLWRPLSRKLMLATYGLAGGEG